MLSFQTSGQIELDSPTFIKFLNEFPLSKFLQAHKIPRKSPSLFILLQFSRSFSYSGTRDNNETVTRDEGTMLVNCNQTAAIGQSLIRVREKHGEPAFNFACRELGSSKPHYGVSDLRLTVTTGEWNISPCDRTSPKVSKSIETANN